MTGTVERGQISYGSELVRKSIHLMSLAIPAIFLNTPHSTGIALLLGGTIVSLGIDIARYFHKPSRDVFMKYMGSLLRKHETDKTKFILTGATWVLIAATLTLGIFPPAVGVPAFTVLIVSDTFAALVGRRYGVRPFLDKSLVGTSTFIVTSWMVVAVIGSLFALPWTFWAAGCIGGTCAGIAEAAAVRTKLDDNIAIPFSMAIIMMLLEQVFLALHYPGFSSLIP